MMQIVKVSNQFFIECKQNGMDKELLFNKSGRPCVLIVHLKYKEKRQRFVVPLRSNIVANTPKEQYFSLPPNAVTKAGNRHGVHYIKLFPIESKYVQQYRIQNNSFMYQIKEILDKNEKIIIEACQNYLTEYEQGKGHPMSPDIDGILSWLKSTDK